MEKDYESELEHDLIMMITGKILDHAIKDGMIDCGIMGGKICPNPFRAFANVNPRMLANYIMEGERLWCEVEQEYRENHPSNKVKVSA